eukprot:IDg6354t1
MLCHDAKIGTGEFNDKDDVKKCIGQLATEWNGDGVLCDG